MAEGTTARRLETDDLLCAALRYAERGWPVLPLHQPTSGGGCSCGRTGCDKQGKHPRTRQGFKDATTDSVQIRQWWMKWPNANIGIATGAPSGLVVVDVDPRNAGDATLADLLDDECHLDEGLIVQTGSGGTHFYFALPESAHIRSRSHALGPGVDLKAEGGYVVAPPSLHSSGDTYLTVGTEGLLGALAPLPSWISARTVDTLSKRSPEAESEGGIREGARNDYLFRVASKLRGDGRSTFEIELALLEENQLRCNPPLDGREVSTIANNVARYTSGRSPFLFTWRKAFMSEAGPHPTTRYVLLALSTYMDMYGRRCFPSVRTLATETGLARDTVKDHLKLAAKNGWILKFARYEDGKQKSNSYMAKIPGGDLKTSQGGAETPPRSPQ